MQTEKLLAKDILIDLSNQREIEQNEEAQHAAGKDRLEHNSVEELISKQSNNNETARHGAAPLLNTRIQHAKISN